MSTLTAITKDEIRAITDADAEAYVARSHAPESIKGIMLHYTKEIYFLQYVLSSNAELSRSESAQLYDEISELREVMEEKIGEALDKEEKEQEEPAEVVAAPQAARTAAAKAAYAQSITEVQQKSSTEAQTWRAAWETRDEGTTPSGIRIMNKVERDELRKTRKFKNRNALWNGRVPGQRYTFGSPKRIGSMADMIAKVRPSSLIEFYEYYTSKVCSWQTIENQAKQFYDYCTKMGHSLTLEEALAEHLIHTLDQTWEGWEREEQAAIQLSAALGCKIGRPAETIWDTDFGIDLIKVDNTDKRDGFYEGYQVKPRHFFTSTNKGVEWARQHNIAKHRKAEALGKRAWFVDGDALARGEVKLIHWSKIQSR